MASEASEIIELVRPLSGNEIAELIRVALIPTDIQADNYDEVSSSSGQLLTFTITRGDDYFDFRPAPGREFGNYSPTERYRYIYLLTSSVAEDDSIPSRAKMLATAFAKVIMAANRAINTHGMKAMRTQLTQDGYQD